MSGLLLLCTELTLFCIELPENCIYLNQAELSNFFHVNYYAIKHQYTALPWFLFSLLEILLFSVHIVNANGAKSGTV